MAAKESFLERAHKHLFDKNAPALFDADEQLMLTRFKDLYSQMLDDPGQPDKSLVDYLESMYGISRATAYRDISNVRVLLSNTKESSKEFMRYTANQMVKEGYQMARDAERMIEVKAAEAMIRAGQALTKINMLDKEEQFKFNPDDIPIDEYEVTSDVTVLGLDKRYENNEELEAAKERLRERFGSVKISDAILIDDEPEEDLPE